MACLRGPFSSAASRPFVTWGPPLTLYYTCKEGRSDRDSDSNPMQWTHKRVVYNPDGTRVKDFISLEENLEKKMGIKIRVSGLPCLAPRG